jgi:hypothetical protein
LGVALYVLLLGWIVYSPGEESETFVPIPTLRAGDFPAPDERLLSEDESLLRPLPKKASGRFELAQRSPRPQAPVTGIDALWWFRETFDLRNSPVEPKAHAKDNAPAEEMIKDPVTGEMHPRSWYDQHVVDSFDHMGGGGGGGTATADARTTANAPDAAPTKSAGGSEHGDGFGASIVEVVVASSSSATSSAGDPVLPKALTFIPAEIPGAHPSILLTGDLSVWHASDLTRGHLWAITETAGADYLVIEAGSGKEMRFLLIRQHPTVESIDISSNDLALRIRDKRHSILDLGDWLSQVESGSGMPEFPPGVDLNDPRLLAELDVLRAKYGDFSPNQVTYGITDEEGNLHLGTVPEPGVMLLLAAGAMMLQRRRRVR